MIKRTNTNIKKKSFPHKGFFLTVILVFAVYQGTALFIEHWFDKRATKDRMETKKQKMIESFAMKTIRLKGLPEYAGKSSYSSSSKTLEDIFNSAADSLASTQKFNEQMLVDIKDFFKDKKENNTLVSKDMKIFDSYVLQLINLYGSISFEQHPSIRLENLSFLKSLVNIHKQEVIRIYSISEPLYRDVYPEFYEMSNLPEALIEDVFLVEYKLRKNKNDYLLSIGGDELKNAYVKQSLNQEMPIMAKRNIIELNRYINNITVEAYVENKE